MKKKTDWQQKFDMFVLEHFDKPFVWGKWDCCIFSDSCIKAMTGQSLIPKQLLWNDKDSALETIRDYGDTLANSIKKACKRKKLENINQAFLQKGDLVIIQQESQVCGMFDGAKTIGPSEYGISAISGNNIIEGWRIN
jgi:hypothetical protein